MGEPAPTAEDVLTWVAAGLAVLAAALSGWQLWRARRRARQAVRRAGETGEHAVAAQRHAERAGAEAQQARGQARWAWEQVKLATRELEHARAEHRAAARVQQWEWAYALTTRARELVEASQELLRVALDTQVAPRYRLAAERGYRQAGARWQDTMIKALAQVAPTLQVQQHISTFAVVLHRLHGQLGVLLRAVETGTLSSDDPLPRQTVEASQELDNARRTLQRAISDSLTNPDTDPPADRQPTNRIAAPALGATAAADGNPDTANTDPGAAGTAAGATGTATDTSQRSPATTPSDPNDAR